MTHGADSTTHETGKARHGGFNARVALLLVGLLVLICASVIATDVLSRRDRNVTPATTMRNQK